jgi:copper homeostasis protein CutC
VGRNREAPISSRLEAAMKRLMKIIAVAAVASISLEVSSVAAENSQKLSRESNSRKIHRDAAHEVHWRYVYDRDGRLRSYSMGTKKIGKWAVEKDELCLYLKEPDDGCYEVALSDVRIEMCLLGIIP